VRPFDLWLIACLMSLSLAVILRVGLQPRDPSMGVAVIYAPWTSADQTMIRSAGAGARFVRFGGRDFIAVVIPEQPDYVERVLADSALLVMDPQVLAACLSSSIVNKASVL
jgi:hypothetical protein